MEFVLSIRIGTTNLGEFARLLGDAHGGRQRDLSASVSGLLLYEIPLESCGLTGPGSTGFIVDKPMLDFQFNKVLKIS